MSATGEDPDLLTTEEAAEFFRVSYWTFRRWAKKHRLEKLQAGRVLRWPRRELQRLLAKLTRQSR